MGVGAGLYMCDVVKKFTFAISSPDEFLLPFESIQTHSLQACILRTRTLPPKVFCVFAVSEATSRHATMSKWAWSFPSFPYSLLRGSQHCGSNRQTVQCFSWRYALVRRTGTGTAYCVPAVRHLFNVAGTDVEMRKSFNLHQTLYDSSTERF